ncbi:MAG TPA: sigma 54-interacting transcriptional regulator [Vicinamibacterales bacterium]|nr:sigma 54-interacting transcriptional regulator [Vicinamibacterales bacterium]
MHPAVTEPWPLPLTGVSDAADRARAAFTAAVGSSAPALLVADQGLDVASIVRAIHERGRPHTALVVVDCAAADPQAIDLELFGTRVRAAAAAELDAIGETSALLRAAEGTLHLANILELPAATQRRLARIVRDREVSVAGQRVALRARIIGDAPASMAVEVGEGHFRSDLFRRLSQTCIAVPRLRERPEDIPELALRIAADLRAGERPAFTQAALTVLSAPGWPGNLDELRGVLDRVLRTAPAGTIRQEDVLAHLPIDGVVARIGPAVSLREARRQFEREYIASVLERHRWRMSEAARTLGIERANLYRKTRQLGIMRRAGAPIAS